MVLLFSREGFSISEVLYAMNVKIAQVSVKSHTTQSLHSGRCQSQPSLRQVPVLWRVHTLSALGDKICTGLASGWKRLAETEFAPQFRGHPPKPYPQGGKCRYLEYKMCLQQKTKKIKKIHMIQKNQLTFFDTNIFL